MKGFKFIFSTALVVLLIFVVIATIFLLTFDANENKQSITDFIKKQTGRELLLEGDVYLSVFPKIAIILGPAELSNAQGFKTKTFAQVDKATISVALLPLLSGDVKVDKIELHGLRVNLETKASGKNNWDDLIKSEGTESNSDESHSEAYQLSIGGIQISDAQLYYSDQVANSKLRLDIIALQTGAISDANKTPLHSVIALQQNATELELVLDTQLYTDFTNSRYQLQDLKIAMTVRMAGLPQGESVLKIAADAKLDLKQELVNIEPMALTLDEDSVHGTFNIKSFSQPKVTAQLSSQSLNLDRWLAPTEEAKAGKQSPTSDEIILPIEMLRSLNILVELTVAQLKVSELSLGNVKTKLHANAGVIEVKAFNADFYQGGINVQGKLDVRQSTPRYAATSVLKKVQLAPLTKDVMAIKKPILKGVAMAQFAITSHGHRLSHLRENLAGNMSFKISDGVLANQGLTRALEQAIALLEGRVAESSGKEILLKQATASATIVNGLLKNKDLKLQTALLDGNGRGQINIAKSRIDYVLKMGLPGAKNKVSLPIRLHGPWADMQYSVDVKAALNGKVNNQIEKEKKKIEKKIKKKAQDIFGDKLKNLF